MLYSSTHCFVRTHQMPYAIKFVSGIASLSICVVRVYFCFFSSLFWHVIRFTEKSPSKLSRMLTKLTWVTKKEDRKDKFLSVFSILQNARHHWQENGVGKEFGELVKTMHSFNVPKKYYCYMVIHYFCAVSMTKSIEIAVLSFNHWKAYNAN